MKRTATAIFTCLGLLYQGSVFACNQQGVYGENLILNPGAEMSGPVNQTGWTTLSGNWTTRSNSPTPVEGNQFFITTFNFFNELELYQDISLAAFSCDIGNSAVEFLFTGQLGSFVNSDTARVVVEYRGAAGEYLGDLVDVTKSSNLKWVPVSSFNSTNTIAPPNTAFIRVRLITRRHLGLLHDGYFDDLNLMAFKRDGAVDYAQHNRDAIHPSQIFCNDEGYKPESDNLVNFVGDLDFNDSSTPDHPDYAPNHPSLLFWDGDDGKADNELNYVAYTAIKLAKERLFAKSCQIEEYFNSRDINFAASPYGNGTDIKTAKLSAVGDIHSYDTSDANTDYLYNDIKNELFGSQADNIAFGNLESPADPSVGNQSLFLDSPPSFNMSSDAAQRYLASAQDQRFTIVSTANNHVFDQGDEGLSNTLEYLTGLDETGQSISQAAWPENENGETVEPIGLAAIGTARTEAEQSKIHIVEKNGVRIAFLAYTFSVNHRWPAYDSSIYNTYPSYKVNYVNLNVIGEEPDITLIENQIALARSDADNYRADFVIVSLHWGMEHEFYPPMRIIDTGHAIADAGADVILGHGPHVLNPMEKYKPNRQPGSAGVDEVLIAYSLGALIPSQPLPRMSASIILQAEFSTGIFNGEKKAWISNVDFVPIWFSHLFNFLQDPPNIFRIINMEQALTTNFANYPFITEGEKVVIAESWAEYIERFTPDSY